MTAGLPLPAPLVALIASVTIYGAAALQAALLHRRREALAFVYPAAIVAALIGIVADLAAVVSGAGGGIALPLGLPQIGLRLEIDALSAFFGFIVNGGVLAAAIYGLGLDRNHDLSPRVEPFFAAFAAAMNLVLLSGDAFAFLFSWELMSLASWALVVSRHGDEASRHAGHVYLIMAAAGSMALLFAFGSLAGAAGGYAFADMRQAAPSAVVTTLALAAALLGAGSKAGIAPLHAWLPLAHSAAPSHVSALMSGVMTKVAIYALIRIVFDLMGPAQWWWALPFLILGALTAVLGLLYAVLDGDLKRVLAYSTVENIGIIFVGLGLALAFKASGLAAAAAVATAAMLLHCLNHSWFKSLLFFGAGAVLHGTGRRDFAALGGLIHRMPVTAALMLAGVLSISALPPFNGFVSEWLLFQAVLAGPAFPEPVLRFLSPAVGAMLALAAALAAACFVRAYGIAFLGRPRSDAAAAARECSKPQQAAMFLMAALCLFGGLFGSVMLDVLQPLVRALAGSAVPGAGTGPTAFALVPFDALRSTYDAPLIAIFLLISGTLTTLLVHRLSSRRTRRSDPWDCGFPEPSPLAQYSASGFSQPLRRIYGSSLFGAREVITMPAPGELAPAKFEATIHDYLWEAIYRAPARGVLAASEKLNRVQLLTIRGYLMLVFAALIALLLLAAVWF